MGGIPAQLHKKNTIKGDGVVVIEFTHKWFKG